MIDNLRFMRHPTAAAPARIFVCRIQITLVACSITGSHFVVGLRTSKGWLEEILEAFGVKQQCQ